MALGINLADASSISGSDHHGLRQELKTAEQRVALRKLKAEADLVALEAAQYAALKVLADPDGLRKTSLLRAIDYLRGILGMIHTDSGGAWRLVEIDESLGMSYGGRPFGLCSKSEQFICDLSLQALLTEIDGSAIMVIDGADILDATGRDGLFRVLQVGGVNAIVGMTTNTPERAIQEAERYDQAFKLGSDQAAEQIWPPRGGTGRGGIS